MLGPASWGGGQALALPGSPLQPATAHKLQGGGRWPTGFKAGPAFSPAQGSFVQLNTSLSGISATPERGNNGVSATHVVQMSLPVQTCPGVPTPNGVKAQLTPLYGTCSPSTGPQMFPGKLPSSLIHLFVQEIFVEYLLYICWV